MDSMKRKRSIYLLSLFLLFLVFLCSTFSISEVSFKSTKNNILSIPHFLERKPNTEGEKNTFSLSIPKISLEVPLYDIEDPKNNVNYNVEINSKSDMPNVIGGNFILEAHSGSGIHSYFKDLYQLKKGDFITVVYHENMYTYELSDSYEILKVGKAQIHRDYGKSTITLITCVGTKKQAIYIGYLIKKECFR